MALGKWMFWVCMTNHIHVCLLQFVDRNSHDHFHNHDDDNNNYDQTYILELLRNYDVSCSGEDLRRSFTSCGHSFGIQKRFIFKELSICRFDCRRFERVLSCVSNTRISRACKSGLMKLGKQQGILLSHYLRAQDSTRYSCSWQWFYSLDEPNEVCSRPYLIGEPDNLGAAFLPEGRDEEIHGNNDMNNIYQNQHHNNRDQHYDNEDLLVILQQNGVYCTGQDLGYAFRTCGQTFGQEKGGIFRELRQCRFDCRRLNRILSCVRGTMISAICKSGLSNLGQKQGQLLTKYLQSQDVGEFSCSWDWFYGLRNPEDVCTRNQPVSASSLREAVEIRDHDMTSHNSESNTHDNDFNDSDLLNDLEDNGVSCTNADLGFGFKDCGSIIRIESGMLFRELAQCRYDCSRSDRILKCLNRTQMSQTCKSGLKMLARDQGTFLAQFLKTHDSGYSCSWEWFEKLNDPIDMCLDRENDRINEIERDDAVMDKAGDLQSFRGFPGFNIPKLPKIPDLPFLPKLPFPTFWPLAQKVGGTSGKLKKGGLQVKSLMIENKNGYASILKKLEIKCSMNDGMLILARCGGTIGVIKSELTADLKKCQFDCNRIVRVLDCVEKAQASQQCSESLQKLANRPGTAMMTYMAQLGSDPECFSTWLKKQADKEGICVKGGVIGPKQNSGVRSGMLKAMTSDRLNDGGIIIGPVNKSAINAPGMLKSAIPNANMNDQLTAEVKKYGHGDLKQNRQSRHKQADASVSTPVYIACMSILVAASVVGVIAAVAVYKHKKSAQRGYRNLDEKTGLLDDPWVKGGITVAI